MPARSLVSNSKHRSLFFALVAVTVAALPATSSELPPKVLPEGFVTPDLLPLAPPSEERLATYEAALAELAAGSGKGPAAKRPRSSDFVGLAVDLSLLWDPEDSLAATHNLTGSPGSLELYEDLGVALLSATRQARFAQENDRGRRHLEAARYAFELADAERRDEGSEIGARDYIHRAMVRLEDFLVTDSRNAWHEAAELLAKQLQVTPDGPMADWTHRILEDPGTYVGEEGLVFEAVSQVGGDVRPPVKIFTPPPRFTAGARKARLQGVVIVQVIIDRHGTVAALKLLKGLPLGLADEALRTMSTWLFQPATLDGRPVTTYYNLTVNFRL